MAVGTNNVYRHEDLIERRGKWEPIEIQREISFLYLRWADCTGVDNPSRLFFMARTIPLPIDWRNPLTENYHSSTINITVAIDGAIGWLVDWLIGWLVGWLVGRLVGWAVRSCREAADVGGSLIPTGIVSGPNIQSNQTLIILGGLLALQIQAQLSWCLSAIDDFCPCQRERALTWIYTRRHGVIRGLRSCRRKDMAEPGVRCSVAGQVQRRREDYCERFAQSAGPG